MKKSKTRPPTPKTPPRLHASIKKEAVNPTDYLNFETRFSCEDCSHFDDLKILCTLGYNPQYHLKAVQTRQYELAGNMAFCRFLEID